MAPFRNRDRSEHDIRAQNRRFHAALEELGIAHEYDEPFGSHNWDYWDSHVLDALAFHCRHLGIGPTA